MRRACVLVLAAQVLAAQVLAFQGPARASAKGTAARAEVALRVLPDSLLLADLPTLVAPKDSDLAIVVANPLFISFFIASISVGLPFLVWLRLASIGDDDAPADISRARPAPAPPSRASASGVAAMRPRLSAPVCDGPKRRTVFLPPIRAPRALGFTPTLPELPELPTIPRTREIVLPFDKVAEKLPDGIADKVPAGLKKQTKAADLIDLLPWNRYNTDFRTTKK